MAEVREQMGDIPVYISFDIDGLDPSVAPGTGTVEMGGLTSSQGLAATWWKCHHLMTPAATPR